MKKKRFPVCKLCNKGGLLIASPDGKGYQHRDCRDIEKIPDKRVCEGVTKGYCNDFGGRRIA